MSLHSYSRIWLHLVWGTKSREHLLPKSAASQVSSFLKSYASELDMYMSINYVNSDHVHVLIDLPVTRSAAEVAKHLKGASSHWINYNDLISCKFSWGRGYGAFSISHTHHDDVAHYIAHQEEHHRRMTFTKEYREFVRRYGLRWCDDA